jgi:hypothetical protein
MSVKAEFSNGGAGFALGGITGANFVPQYILYYQLNVIKHGSSDPTNWTFEYPQCGIYDSVDIAQFIQLAVANDLPGLSPTSDNPLVPGSITVTDPCYVVIQLLCNDTTLMFHKGVEGLKTADDHSSQYRRLAHVDTSGNITFGTSSATADCKLIYFAVKSVQINEDDAYNMYVQLVVAGQTKMVVFEVIDPAIKNRGGDDDFLVQRARQDLESAVSRRRARRQLRKDRARKPAGTVEAETSSSVAKVETNSPEQPSDSEAKQ